MLILNKTNGVKNIVFGVISYLLTIGLGLIVPRLVLLNLGSESNGLLSSVTSMLSYMSLLEAGVGTATLNALYKPLSERNHDAINGIMSATNHFYRRTGYIYLVLVLVMSVGYTFAVRTTLPKLSVFLIVLLTGLTGVISYFFQGKFRLFLMADGKNYIVTGLSTIVSVITSLLKAFMLVNGFDVLALQTMYFILNMVQMVVIIAYMRKQYRWIDLRVKPDFEAISQKNAVLVHQVAGIVFSNIDVALLTIFNSLNVVSVYSMYNLIFGTVKAVVVTISDSYTYALGQSYSNRNRFIRLFDVYETFYMAFTYAVYCILGILMLPFLKLYTAGVTDINYIDPRVLALFIIYFLLHSGRAPSARLIEIAQEFENTKWRAVLEMGINIVVSIVMTAKFGIYGVLLGTIAALIYRTNDMIIYAARLLKRSPLITYKRWIVNILTFAAVSTIALKIPIDLSSYFNMVVYGIVFSVTIIPLFLLVNSAFDPRTAKAATEIIKPMAIKIFRRR